MKKVIYKVFYKCMAKCNIAGREKSYKTTNHEENIRV